MRILLFDPFHGAAGDMVTGALLALLTDRAPVIRAMASVAGEPKVTEVDRAGIRAVQVRTQAGKARRTLEQVESRVREAEAPETRAICRGGRRTRRFNLCLFFGQKGLQNSCLRSTADGRRYAGNRCGGIQIAAPSD